MKSQTRSKAKLMAKAAMIMDKRRSNPIVKSGEEQELIIVPVEQDRRISLPMINIEPFKEGSNKV